MNSIKYWPDILSSVFIIPVRKPTFFDNCLAWNNDPELPATNIREDEKNYLIELAVPGLNKKDIQLEVENKRLTISAKVKKESQVRFSYLHKEYQIGDFCRSFSFPDNANRDNIQITYESGILKINVKKITILKNAIPINLKGKDLVVYLYKHTRLYLNSF